MDGDDRSHVLFGRYQALRVYATIARLAKPEFTTGQLQAISGVGGSNISKELSKLVSIDLVRATSRRGDYERIDHDDPFWVLVSDIADRWGI